MTTDTEEAPLAARGFEVTMALLMVGAVAIVVGLAAVKPALLIPATAIVALVAAARYVLVRVHHRP